MAAVNRNRMADWGIFSSGSRDILSLYGHDLTNSAAMTTAMAESLFTSSSLIEKSDENTFCTCDNVDDCLTFVNQELVSLGLHPCDRNNKEVCLVNSLYEIIRMYQKAGRIKEELENRVHRANSELEHHQSSNHRLKSDRDRLEREVAKEQEKCRQVTVKHKSMTGKLKSEKEEVKRLLSLIKDRDCQYKHELKKKEREINKLKEKLHQMISEKTPNRRMGLDIVNNLQRADGRRSQWNTGAQDKQEEMYKSVISCYEEKQRELMMENTDLRDCLAYMQKELKGVVNKPEFSSQNVVNNNNVDEFNDEQNPAFATNGHSDLSEGYFQMPYDLLRANLVKSFNDICQRIKENMQMQCKTSGVRPSKPSVITNSPTSSPKVIEAKLKEETDKLQKQIGKYKEIIRQQEEYIQHSIQSQSKSVEDSFLHESILLQEKESFAEQRRLFYQEKSNFEDERRRHTEATIRLSKERRAFHEERASLVTNQFLQISPFTKSTPHRRAGGKEGSRLLPSTPVFSPAPSKTPKTPTTVELYRVLGLRDKDLSKYLQKTETKDSSDDASSLRRSSSSDSLESPNNDNKDGSTRRTLFRRRSSTGSQNGIDL